MPAAGATRAGVRTEPFGQLPDGRPVHRFVLRNRRGVAVRVLDYGAIIQALRIPDRAGRFADVVLGFDRLEEYLAGSPYFGAVVGRYANRIAGGVFTLDGQRYQLARNDGPNHLHGGTRGFDKVLWQAAPSAPGENATLRLRYRSTDGEEGYPGNLSVQVSYTLTDDDELVIDYEARTDRATPVNLSQHTYFNLAGAGAGDVGAHLLTISADSYTPVDATLIPTGAVVAVAGTPFDFTHPTPVGARVDADDEQLGIAGGYDHNFVLIGADDPRAEAQRTPAGMMVHAARLQEPVSGRVLDVFTTEPGLQFYSGNFLDGSLTGKGGRVYVHRAGLCLETQHFPDSPNHPEFPSTILRPGEVFRSRTVWRFAVADR